MKLKDLEPGQKTGSCGLGHEKRRRSALVAALGHFLKHEVYIMTIISE
jgi:hypothetical protein